MATIFVEWEYADAFENLAKPLIHHFELLPAGMLFYVYNSKQAYQIYEEIKAR